LAKRGEGRFSGARVNSIMRPLIDATGLAEVEGGAYEEQ